MPRPRVISNDDRNVRALIACLAAGLVTLGCGSEPTRPTGSDAETLELRLTTTHFRLFAGRASTTVVQSAADALEREYARVLSDLNVTTPLGPISVQIWQDEATYYGVLDRYFGVHYQATGYVTSRDELRVLAVSQLDVNVVHEFCHAVSLSVSSTFGNNPRWLWETVALYENGELVQPRTLDYMVRGAYPSLADLNADPNAGRQIYQVGYVIGEFIVARWNRTGLLNLIRAHGDVTAVFGMTPAAFEAEMYAWIRAKYL